MPSALGATFHFVTAQVSWEALHWADLYDILVLGMLLVLGLNALLNACFFPRLRPQRLESAQDRPRISVLIPARNEAHQIERCLQSLREQTYENVEILVLDDDSSDGTAEVVEDLGFIRAGADERSDGRYLLLQGEPLPRGWTGKCWACHQLAAKATGDYLLFTDADTVHHPQSVESVLELAHRQRADLVSVWPHQITVTWSEKLVIPMVAFLGCLFWPQWMLQLAVRVSPRRLSWIPKKIWERVGAANGQYLFFTKDGYADIGGHQAIREELVEDVAFGRRMAQRLPRGGRLLNVDGHDVVECRMYGSFPEVWEGFSKNLYPVFRGRERGFALVGVLLLLTFLLPFFLFLARDQPWLVALQVQVILLLRLLITVRFATSWMSLVLHPFSLLMVWGIGLNSWWQARHARLAWKGRVYDEKGRAGDPYS